MGLLDSVIGAVAGQLQAGEGLQGLMDSLGVKPELLQAATSLLGNDGGVGGLQGLIAKFQQGGLGDVVNSWVGNGENVPISGDQLSEVLGADALSGLAGKFGMDGNALAGQLSNVLPGLVDKLTPGGELPAAGLGNGGDLMGMLGGLLKG
jgi:uncharacterized protein YidB (DUF937 family)